MTVAYWRAHFMARSARVRSHGRGGARVCGRQHTTADLEVPPLVVVAMNDPFHLFGRDENFPPPVMEIVHSDDCGAADLETLLRFGRAEELDEAVHARCPVAPVTAFDRSFEKPLAAPLTHDEPR